MPKLVDLAAKVAPKPPPKSSGHGGVRKPKLVEQKPVSADAYDQGVKQLPPPVVLAKPVVEVRRVEVPVLPSGDPRNPFIAKVLAQVAELLAPATDPKRMPVLPSQEGMANALRSFARAEDVRESDSCLVYLAATVIAFAARRQEDRCRVYSQQEPSK